MHISMLGIAANAIWFGIRLVSTRLGENAALTDTWTGFEACGLFCFRHSGTYSHGQQLWSLWEQYQLLQLHQHSRPKCIISLATIGYSTRINTLDFNFGTVSAISHIRA